MERPSYDSLMSESMLSSSSAPEDELEHEHSATPNGHLHSNKPTSTHPPAVERAPAPSPAPSPSSADKPRRGASVNEAHEALAGYLRSHAGQRLATRVSVCRYSLPPNTETGVVEYHLQACNEHFLWELRARFSHFLELFEEMERIFELRIVNSARRDGRRRVRAMPAFPEKALRLFTDHSERDFIERRLVLLNQFLKRVNSSRERRWCLSEQLTAFLMPGVSPATFVGLRRRFPPGREPDPDADQDDMADAPEQFQVDSPMSCCWPIEDSVEFKSVTVPKAQILRHDHVIYHVDVFPATDMDSWVVLKRFDEFRQLDEDLQRDREQDQMRYGFFELPTLPPRYPKLFVDHLERRFIETRRVLLEWYVQRLVATPQLQNPETECGNTLLTFLNAM